MEVQRARRDLQSLETRRHSCSALATQVNQLLQNMNLLGCDYRCSRAMGVTLSHGGGGGTKRNMSTLAHRSKRPRMGKRRRRRKRRRRAGRHKKHKRRRKRKRRAKRRRRKKRGRRAMGHTSMSSGDINAAMDAALKRVGRNPGMRNGGLPIH